jgi:chromosomal replication initiation ATPase DnaA
MTPQVKRAALARVAHKGIGWKLAIVASAAAEVFALSMADIRGGRCDQYAAMARHVAFFLCREMTNASFPELGAWFDRDHSTVLHSVGLMTRLKRKRNRPHMLERVQRRAEEMLGPQIPTEQVASAGNPVMATVWEMLGPQIPTEQVAA